ncbi:MAG: HRDC domain-containing protein [Chloroflexota bacterium]|nr:HRDC domain-containing protein [Chloroflexota bacterium]
MTVKPANHEEVGDADAALLEKLRAWRLEKAHTQAVAPFMIFHNDHLRAIAAAQPETLETLRVVKGIGPKRLERYGEQLLQIIEQHTSGE